MRLVLLTSAVLLAAPASAQELPTAPSSDVSVGAGYASFSAAFDDEVLGLETGYPARFAPSPFVQAEATGWVTPRVGLRGAVRYTRTELRNDEDGLLRASGPPLTGDINLWGIEGSLILRLTDPESSLLWPYIRLGGGATVLSEPDDNEFVVPNRAQPDTFVVERGVQPRYSAGLGLDIPLALRAGIRSEAGLAAWSAPIRHRGMNQWDAGKWVREPYLTIALSVLLGRDEALNLPVAGSPPAPPRPVQVLVEPPLDPIAQAACKIDDPRRDAPASLTPPLARWAARGEPFTLRTSAGAISFVLDGPSVVRSDLEFLGMSGRQALYVASTDPVLHAVSTPLDPVTADVGTARALLDVERIYLLVDRDRCAVQPLRRLERTGK